MKKMRVLGVCGGNGVCLYPFKDLAAFDIVGNIEPRGVFYDKHNNQWEANFPGIPQWRNQPPKLGRVDVVIGHPDCGDNSILRMSRAKKKGEVRDNQSINLFLNSVTKYQPDYWLLENLPGFLDTHSIDFLETFYLDYNILHWVESVSKWGNSQITRKRLIIVGVKRGLSSETFKLSPKAIQKVKYAQEFELGYKEIPGICHVREPEDKLANLYYKHLRQVTYRKAQEIWKNEYTGSRWPVGGKMKNQPGVSRNLRDTYPSTVRKQNRQFGTQGWVLSPREMANIQGVPTSFNLIFFEGQRIYWINKSRLTVTKTMPYQVARWFRNCILKSIRRD